MITFSLYVHVISEAQHLEFQHEVTNNIHILSSTRISRSAADSY